MVTIALTGGTRPKAVTVTSLDSVLDEVQNGTIGPEGSNGFNVPVEIANYVLDQITVADTVTDGSTTTITSVTGFTGVRLGMVVAGTGIQVGSVVASITDINTIDLDLPTTAAGTISATFDYTGTATLGLLNVSFAVAGSTLRITPRLYTYDGTDVTNTALTTGDATGTVAFATAPIDIDAYQTASGVARTN